MATFRVSGILDNPPNNRKTQNIICNIEAMTKFGAKRKTKKAYKSKYPNSGLKIYKVVKVN